MDGLQRRSRLVDIGLGRAVYLHNDKLAASSLGYGIQGSGALVSGVRTPAVTVMSAR